MAVSCGESVKVFRQNKSKGKGGKELDKLCMYETLWLWAGWNEGNKSMELS